MLHCTALYFTALRCVQVQAHGRHLHGLPPRGRCRSPAAERGTKVGEACPSLALRMGTWNGKQR